MVAGVIAINEKHAGSQFLPDAVVHAVPERKAERTHVGAAHDTMRIERRCVVTEYGGVTVDGLAIWGSPWQPWFYDWAFNLERGEEIAMKWRLIPADPAL